MEQIFPLTKNLPEEISSLKRFFPVKIVDGKKIPEVTAWQNPTNQTTLDNINGLVGFDTCGHEQGADYLFVDFDHVLNDNGDFINQDAQKWFNYLTTAETYCEKSISGHGLHFFFKPTAELFKGVKLTGGNNCSIFLDENNHDIKIELFYRQNRYCLLTGDVYQCEPCTPITDGDAADEFFQQLINAITLQNHTVDTTSQTDLPQADFDLNDAKTALNSIPCKKITRDIWAVIGMALKDTYGDKGFDLWNTWSQTDPDRYTPDACKYQWAHFGIGKIQKPVTIATLIFHAKKYGYKPPRRKQNTLAGFDEDLQAKITDWQKHFGKINPAVLKTLKDAAERIKKAEITSEFAKDLIIQEFLGKFRFYTFYSSIEENFFIELKAAKKSAKKKISDYDKDNQNPEPTDAERALDILDISEIEKRVKTFSNAAKREHKNYIEQLECDKLNEQEQADLKKREKETTAGNVKDCPIDLKIPTDCYFNQQGNSIVDNSGKFRKRIIATKNPIVPTKIFRDPTNHNTQYEIAIKTGDFWRHSLVDGQSLFDPRKVISLAGTGALIEEPKALVKFFARIIATNDLPQIKCYSQPGWHDDDFKTFIYPTGTDDYIVRRAGFDYEKFFATRGDRELWKKYFLEACEVGGAKVKAFIGAALASLLVRPLNLPNLQIQIFGKSGSGKTALEKLTASIYGNPRKIIGTFAATQKNRIAQAAAFNDLPSFFDELETLNGKKAEEALPEMIYNYAEGKGNQANKRDGSVRETFEFFGSRLMTAERKILKSHDKRGAYKRLIQLYCEKLFEDSFAAKLHFVTETNFGHYGKIWADFVVSHLPKIQEIFRYISRVFTEFPPAVEPGQLKNACVDLMCFQLFLSAIGEKDEFNYQEFEADIMEIISNLPTAAELDDSTRAINDLKSFVAGHDKYFAHEQKDNSADGYTLIGAQAWECFGKKFKNGEVAFFPTALRKILENELGFADCDSLIDEFSAKGFLRCGKGRGNRFSTRINGKVVSAIIFKAGALFNDEEDCDTEEFSAEY